MIPHVEFHSLHAEPHESGGVHLTITCVVPRWLADVAMQQILIIKALQSGTDPLAEPDARFTAAIASLRKALHGGQLVAIRQS